MSGRALTHWDIYFVACSIALTYFNVNMLNISRRIIQKQTGMAMPNPFLVLKGKI